MFYLHEGVCSASLVYADLQMLLYSARMKPVWAA